MLLNQIILGIFGLSFGLLSSAGVFTVLSSVGLIPRFAGKMHVADKVFALEEAVIFGTILGCIVSVFPDCFQAGNYLLSREPCGESTAAVVRVAGTVFLCFYGFLSGIFIGCLAFAIAEMLDSIPIFARRASFRHGLGVAIAAAAFGKLFGSLFYFSRQIFLSGM